MGARDKEGIIKIWDGSITSTQMGREVLEGLRVMPKPAAPITQESTNRSLPIPLHITIESIGEH